MSLESKINDEIKIAMKSGDKTRLDALRSIRAAIIEFNKSGADREANEADEMKIINIQAKKRKDAIDLYEKAGRTDLLEKEKNELAVIQEFLPQQLSNDEIIAVVKQIIEKTGASGPKDMGKVMGASMKELTGKADGSAVQGIVKELLGAN